MRKSIRAWRFVKTLGASVVLLCLVLTQKTYAEDWVYTVRKGDTLWDLCIEYTVRKNCWMEIGPYNEVDFPPSLAPGTRIRFPTAWLKNRPQEVEVIFLRGDVQIAENTETRAATLNEHLSTGIKILTGDDASATLLFADGTTLVMEENSELNLDTLSQHETFDSTSLAIHWQMPRVKFDNKLGSMTARPDALRLYGRESIVSKFEQSLVARRQQAM